jgi:hypothetical protein
MGPRRDWTDARAKVAQEAACRNCGTSQNLEAAHVAGRRYDQPKREGGKTLWVNPLDIIPLCGPFPAGCHGAEHRHDLDIKGLLTVDELARFRDIDPAGAARL